MLVAALHDVAPCHLRAIAQQRELLARWGIGRATLLVVPDFHGRSPLGESPQTRRWLRGAVAAGDEVCLHGRFHLAEPGGGALDRVRAALFSAGEGECLAQTRRARACMLAEKARLEDVVGAPVRGFVAPAWLEPAGLAPALRDAGFQWHESRWWLESLAAGGPRLYGPALAFATRTTARRLAALAWVAALARPAAAAARLSLGVVRIALHPADLASPAVMAAAQRTVRAALIYNPAVTASDALGLPLATPARAREAA